MPERIKQIPKQILEFWNRYTSKQKTIIISVVAAIFLAIVVLSYVLSQTKYTQLYRYEDLQTAKEVVDLLEENQIKYKLSDDALTVNVDKKDYTTAQLLVGSNGLTGADSGLDWVWALDTDMSTTSQDRQQRNILATQDYYRRNLMKMDPIKEATVIINEPKDPYSILQEQGDTAITLILTLEDVVPDGFGETLAQAVANGLGSQDTSKVSIIDSKGNMIFSGDNGGVLDGANYTKEEYKQKLQNTYSARLKQLLLKNGFDDVEVGNANIKLNFDKVEELYTEYTPQEGREEGLYSHSYEYKTSSTGSANTGTPGTDSNQETDYMGQNQNQTSGQTTLNKYDYIPNELKRTINKEVGAVIPEESSIALVLTTYTIYDEKTMTDSGQLNNMTFDQFIAANNTPTKGTVDQDTLNLISMTTGIPTANIAVTVWDKPVFQAEVKEGFNFSNYLMIILAVLIIALLIFVVFKGTAPIQETEMEPELTIDHFLATTTEDQSLDDIEFSDKSETRKMIEKFVDENPEAVAQLLRNWLNEDWG